MKYSFKDSKVFLDKDKRLYTTANGIEIDLTWKPSIIDKLYKEYVTLQAQVVDEYPKLQEAILLLRNGKNEAAENLKKYTDNLDLYKAKETEIIITALKANDREVDENWVLENLIQDETGIIVSIIMGVEQNMFNLPKKNQ